MTISASQTSGREMKEESANATSSSPRTTQVLRERLDDLDETMKKTR
jgi:hypothetical protein